MFTKSKKTHFIIIIFTVLVIIIALSLLLPIYRPKANKEDYVITQLRGISAIIGSKQGVLVLEAKDPWGNNIIYDLRNNILCSIGKDGTSPSDDIIVKVALHDLYVHQSSTSENESHKEEKSKGED
jgi:hypothetical protein